MTTTDRSRLRLSLGTADHALEDSGEFFSKRRSHNRKGGTGIFLSFQEFHGDAHGRIGSIAALHSGVAIVRFLRFRGSS